MSADRKKKIHEVAQAYAENLILYPQYSASEIEEFAGNGGLRLGDDEMADVILETNRCLLEAYKIWTENR